MEFLLSWVGAVLCCLYVLLAVVVRLMGADYWVLGGIEWYVISLPGMWILGRLGFDPERVLVPALCITALLLYLTGAALELTVRALSG